MENVQCVKLAHDQLFLTYVISFYSAYKLCELHVVSQTKPDIQSEKANVLPTATTMCPDGHEMKIFKPQNSESFTCDGCEQKVTNTSTLYGCRACNYDLCQNCHKTMPSKIQQLSQLIKQKDHKIKQNESQLSEKESQIQSLQQLVIQASSSYQTKEPIELKKILVLIICVATYSKKSDINHIPVLDDLPGTKTDKSRLLNVFRNNYKYDIIMNKDSYVTNRDVEIILNKAKEQFRMKQNGYQAIIVLYSGHGDRDHLLLSNYDSQTLDGRYRRDMFESHFNGYKIPEKSDCYKFYFVDSCRGHIDAELINKKRNDNQLIKAKGNEYNNVHEWQHPEENRCVMYSNMDNYRSYEVPFDKSKDDIAWDIMADENKKNDQDDNKDKETEYCGIFMNSIYKSFKRNSENNYLDNFSNLQDKMRLKSIGAFPVKDAPNMRVGLSINESGNLMNSIKMRIVFGCNNNKIMQEYQHRISLLNQLAAISQSNIEYV